MTVWVSALKLGVCSLGVEMKAFAAVVAGLVVWSLAALVLIDIFHALSGSDLSPAPVFIQNWMGSMVALLAAREVAEKICRNNHRPHAFVVATAALLALLTLATSALGSPMTWATLGTLVACGVEWRTSGASFRARRS